MTGRIVGFILAAILNAGIVYALATGLASTAVKLAIQNIKVAVIKPPAPDQTKPPPPPPPTMKEPPPFVPPPDINIDVTEAAPATTAITTTTQVPTAPAAPAPVTSPPKALNSHAVGPNDYPPISIRLSEQGIVTVRYLVSLEGTVEDVQVTASSGKQRLDDAAIAMVKRWRFKPALQEGRPVTAWQVAQVKFQLR